MGESRGHGTWKWPLTDDDLEPPMMISRTRLHGHFFLFLKRGEREKGRERERATTVVIR